ncbi:MAG: pantoate--beta-alanine ligase [Chitinispirillaceae bacterium]
MKIISSHTEMKNLSLTYRRSGRTVGLVPTMGALHEGHLSLIKRAAEQVDITVTSIFVNPIQFGPKEDLDKYPRTLERDRELAEAAGSDLIFAPSLKDIYPENYSTFIEVENVTETLCGANRPGHFRGVATVVLKLFNIVCPQVAVFGQKDAQQVVVIRRMINDLNLSVQLEVAPIVREEDGLALSSRNQYLSDRERAEVPRIYEGLRSARDLYEKGERSASKIRQKVLSVYSDAENFIPEYVEVADLDLLKPLQNIDSTALVAVACRTKESGTRIIDNITLGGDL